MDGNFTLYNITELARLHAYVVIVVQLF